MTGSPCVVSIQLGRIVDDYSIYPREDTDPNHVSRMRDSYRAGWEPPRILLDQDNKIVDGWHRYKMYLLEHSPDFEVEVDRRYFASRGERIETAARMIEKGKSFAGKDFARIIDLLDREGYETERIAIVIGHTPAFVEKRRLRIRRVENDSYAVVRNPDLYRRRAESVESVLTLTRPQVEVDRHDVGLPTQQLAHLIINRLRVGNVRLSPTAIEALRELHAVLSKWLEDDEA